MPRINLKDPDLPEFIRNFGLAAGKKAAICQTGRQHGEWVELVDPEVVRMGYKLRSLRLSKGLTRRELACRAGVDYTDLVLLEHGLLEYGDSFGSTGCEIMAALSGEPEDWARFNPVDNAGPLIDLFSPVIGS